MTQCIQPRSFFTNRKIRKEKMLRKMKNMRAAKERKQQAAIAAGWRSEPRPVRAHRFEFGVRNKATGEMAWHDLVSVRHATKALGLILKYL